MATINIGPFGNDVTPMVRRGRAAEPVPGAFDTTGGLAQVAQGFQAGSDVAAQAAQNERRLAEIEAHRQKEEADHAALVEETTRARRDIINLGERAQTQATAITTDDTIPRDQKQLRLDDWLQTERGGLEPTYTLPSVQGAQAGNIDALGVKIRKSMLGQLVKVDQAKTAANLAQTVESLGRQALNAPTVDDLSGLVDQTTKYIHETSAAAGMDALEAQKMSQNVAETFSYSHAASRLLDDPAGMLATLKSGGYKDLDPNARVALESRAQAEIEQRDNRARVLAEVRESKAERSANALEKSYRDGVQPTPAMVATTADLARGTASEGRVSQMVNMSADRASFASAPIAQQSAELERLGAQSTNPSAGMTPAERFQFDWKKDQFAAQQRRIASDGALQVYADSHGIKLPQLAAMTPDQVPTAIGQLRDVALEASVWSGKTVGPFTPDAAKQFGQSLEHGNANDRLRMLDGLRMVLTDPETFRQTTNELAKGKANLATAGNFLQDGDKRAADLIVRGDLILKPTEASGLKAPPFPSNEHLQGTFEEQTGGLFQGNATDRDRLYQASRAVYAGLTQDAGVYSDVKDDDRWKEAIQIASGGIVDVAGFFSTARRVIKPPSMSASDFSAAVSSVTPEQVQSAGGAAGWAPEQVAAVIRDGSIKNAGQGYVVMDGVHPIMKADGSGPFIWDPMAPPLPR